MVCCYCLSQALGCKSSKYSEIPWLLDGCCAATCFAPNLGRWNVDRPKLGVNEPHSYFWHEEVIEGAEANQTRLKVLAHNKSKPTSEKMERGGEGKDSNEKESMEGKNWYERDYWDMPVSQDQMALSTTLYEGCQMANQPIDTRYVGDDVEDLTDADKVLKEEEEVHWKGKNFVDFEVLAGPTQLLSLRYEEAKMLSLCCCYPAPLVTPIIHAVSMRRFLRRSDYDTYRLLTNVQVRAWRARLTSDALILSVPEVNGGDSMFDLDREDQPRIGGLAPRLWLPLSKIDDIQTVSMKVLPKHLDAAWNGDLCGSYGPGMTSLLTLPCNASRRGSHGEGDMVVDELLVEGSWKDAQRGMTFRALFAQPPQDIVDAVEAVKAGTDVSVVSAIVAKRKASGGFEASLKEELSAGKIQKVYKGAAVRKEVKKEKAAITVQKSYRGHSTRKVVRRKKDVEERREFYDLCLAVKERLSQEGVIRDIAVENLWKSVVEEQIPPDGWEEYITATLTQ